MFRATYRLQLHKDFPLTRAAQLTGYLGDLGVSHVYLSPIFEARAGSHHGYDGTDPTRISIERGGEEGFRKLVERVEKNRHLAGLILDIVPNHLAASWQNPYWWDVLDKGERSRWFRSFDIRHSGRERGRLILPVLGRSRPAILAARELVLDFDHERGFHLRYWDHLFPIAAGSYPLILNTLAQSFNEASPKARVWRDGLQSLMGRRPPRSGAVRAAPLKSPVPDLDPNKAQALRKKTIAFLQRDAILERVARLHLKALPLKVLETILDQQFYSLEDWREGSRQINYRRFFDINDLAALRMEDEATFRWTHSKLRDLVHRYPIVHGVRVDHIDGLTDPESYLKKLKGICPHVWVEKILGEKEVLPPAWPVTGTTGYEFLGASARLFVDLTGLLQLQSFYCRSVDNRWERFHDCVYNSKREMLETHFVSELAAMTGGFWRLARRGRGEPGFTEEELREAIMELSSSLRVYRTYMAGGGLDEESRRWLRDAFLEAEGRGRVGQPEALEWLRRILLDRGDWSEEAYHWIKRWEQLTGPVMAKGLEDTALYRYFPLLSLNTVGGEPDWTGDGAIEFHAFNRERLRDAPLTMSTSSTHDTKRSEDVRSRIHVISELSEEWVHQFRDWREMNKRHRAEGRLPDPGMEYLIYETLLGAWPMDGRIDAEFVTRMKQYFLKAAREAKSGTSWTEPDAAFEGALLSFVDRILDTHQGRAFLKSFSRFAGRTSWYGAFYSLSALTLKLLSPGLSDIYQGTELWDLSLVDPDNRRPVDFNQRRELLAKIKREVRRTPDEFFQRIRREWRSGEIKLWLTWSLLQLRERHTELILNGDYIALEPIGEGRRHFVAFARRWHDQWLVVTVPRRLVEAVKIKPELVIREPRVLKTELSLPDQAPRQWRSWLSGQEIAIESGQSLAMGDLMQGLPVGIWLSK